jgi:long-chain acyl-CoA synthetase
MTTETAQCQQDRRDTWPQVLKYNHEKYADHRRAMRHKHRGTWRSFSWQDYYRDVKCLALGLLSLGFEAGDKVLIIGNNAPQWYHAELAAQANRGVAVGVHPGLTPSETKRISENSDARLAIVEDQEQVDKLLEIKDELPRLEKVLYWNYKGLAHYDDSILMGYRQVLQLGEQYEKEHPGLFEQNVEAGRADDVCVIVYGSGTPGAVKGAVYTYRTVCAAADAYLQLDQWYETDNVVPYLPPVCMVEQCFGIACHLLSACTLNFGEAPETYRRDTREIGPQIISRQAQLWESQATMVQARILDSDGIKRLAFRLCMPIGYRMADSKYRKQKPNLFLKLLYALANIVLFKPMRGNLGLSNARICYSSGDMLTPDTVRFYHALDLPLRAIEEVVG